MKIAILSDIHGNDVALQAVLKDLAGQGGADHIIVGGDLFVYGPTPHQVLHTLQRLPNAHILLGNTDRYLLQASYPPVMPDDRWQSALLSSFRWAAYQLDGEGMRFLAALPPSQVIQAGGRQLLAVHGSPRSDEEGFTLKTRDDELHGMSIAPQTAIIACAHTHVPMERTIGGVQVVNAGSVGLPFDGDPSASYALIAELADGGSHPARVELRRVAYDVEETVRQLYAAGHPAAAVGAYNLRQARSFDSELIYTPEMRATARPEHLSTRGSPLRTCGWTSAEQAG